MAYTAYISTKEGDNLSVRNRANGDVVTSLTNGTEVTVISEPIFAGSRNWVQIGTNRWVAHEFLTVIRSAKLVAKRTTETINGLRIYQTRLIDGTGKVINTVRAVSGRANKQTPSHIAGSQTPLPFGIYKFDFPGSVKFQGGEFGGVWSPVTPIFKTGRSEIGVHYDPSALLKNADSGTAGCFATPTTKEKDIMTNFIRTYQPTHLIVYEG
ncbi:SH3 domain-containing protein [Calothrix sp. UHCC 0171]|uniref:SH3 domain-containing protein n=1 Tax=Calothrix sp. UHCC 0171 TaxID=3110245 RepID=UPI002B21F7E7|nr:SH3 domain-containing protein [Calothrix sp. UHCC 0171]MEA5571082.1 SH3 domain-containing protein [Calothrix sp. UHCC 0171]